MTIYEKLSNIQAELKVPKNRTGKGVFYKYRSCEDIQENAKPICKKNKALLLISETVELIGERFYIKATASLYDLDDPKQFVFVTAFVREADTISGQSLAQLSGTTSSYAKKRALCDLFQIDDSEDDGEEPQTNGKPQESAGASQRLATPRKADKQNDTTPTQKTASRAPQNATEATEDTEEERVARIKAKIKAAAMRTGKANKEIFALVTGQGYDVHAAKDFKAILKFVDTIQPEGDDPF